jgi:hypothetical protein
MHSWALNMHPHILCILPHFEENAIIAAIAQRGEGTCPRSSSKQVEVLETGTNPVQSECLLLPLLVGRQSPGRRIRRQNTLFLSMPLLLSGGSLGMSPTPSKNPAPFPVSR